MWRKRKQEHWAKGLLTRIMETAARKLECDKGTLYLFDKKTNELWTVVLQNDLISEIRLAPSQGMAGRSFKENEILNIEDAYQSPYFNRDIDRQSGYVTRSALCIPVIDSLGTKIGVVQMINKLDGIPFNDDDIDRLKEVVKEIADLLDTSKTWRGLIPGLGLVAVTALVGWAAHSAVPATYQDVVSPILFFILIGIAISNMLILPMRYLPGIRYCLRQLLRMSIVLMGARLALSEIADVGVGALAIIVALIFLAFGIATAAGRLLGVHQRLSTLVAVGTSVCGGSAIAAVAPTIKARDEEFSFAISVNTLMGTIAVFSFPLIGRLLGFDDAIFGMWAGTAVNDTAQVVATGYAYSEASGDMATVIKLTRNATMVFIVVGIGFYFTAAEKGSDVDVKKIPVAKRIRESIPGFVLGFLLLSLFNTLGVFDWLSGQSGIDVTTGISNTAFGLTLLSLTGIGLGINLAKIRQTGINAIMVSLITFVGATAGSIVLISLVAG